MVGTIICEVGTINVRFYLLEVRYSYGYCRITHVIYIYIMINMFIHGFVDIVVVI